MSEENRPGRRMKPIAAEVPPARRAFALKLRELVERSLPEGTPAGALAPLVPMAKSTLFHYLSGNRLPGSAVLESLLDVLWTIRTHPGTLQLPYDEIEGGIERLAAPREQVSQWMSWLDVVEAEEPQSTRAGGRDPLRVAQSRTSRDRAPDVAVAVADAYRTEREDLWRDTAQPYQEYLPGSADGSVSVAEALRAVREAQRGVQQATTQLGRAQDRLARALVAEGHLSPEALDDDLVSLKQRFDTFRDRHEVDGARQRIQLLLTRAEQLTRQEDRLTEATRRRAARSAQRLRDLYARLDRADAEPDPDLRRLTLQEIYRLLEEREKLASLLETLK
ncbi:hypothetical protein [Streptomyces sp. NPDC088762]|uniref:hypothetical protein n=1 Tax=Streptomyces sp. NPDC088762 TaxID=3365891 RepID=UPI00382CD0C0